LVVKHQSNQYPEEKTNNIQKTNFQIPK
jgi:hypothetical protein